MLRQDALPEEMRVLLYDYPRDSWESNPHFKQPTRNWIEAHRMFRRLGELVRTETESYLDKSRAAGEYASRLYYYGGVLVQNLHGHHHFEDHSYFPELLAADPRFASGLEVLGKDHEELEGVLGHFTEEANRVLGLIRSNEDSDRGAAGAVLASIETIEAFFARHLSDEEELAVPIILHHRLRG